MHGRNSLAPYSALSRTRPHKRLDQAFRRLQGMQFITNIQTGNRRETRMFGLVDEGGYVMKSEGSWRLDYCEVVLSDWLMRAIESDEVVTISNDYFRLRRPLERRIYEIARKHCGAQKKWHIGLAKLQEKTGSNAPLKKFRLNLRQIIADDHTPFYKLELTKDDLVIFRPRTPTTVTIPQHFSARMGRRESPTCGPRFRLGLSSVTPQLA